MGFLKRFFSLTSSKKSKKKQKHSRNADSVDSEGRIVQTQNPDADVNRLLRSTSARFAVVAELDYASLPPLPHPINHLAPTPTFSSSHSPARSTASVQRSGTYVVKVHERTLHSRTEFPNANPPLLPHDEPRTPEQEQQDRHGSNASRPPLKEVLFTPRDEGRLLALRRDPSVASLLNMYDEQGRLDSNAFSNTPPTPAPIHEGHEQRKRTGSTLRQLLGNPDVENSRHGNTTEGDISWAERFLEEQDGGASPRSSSSSLPPDTPTDTLFPHDLSERHITTNTSFSGFEHETSMNCPAISSLEVEVSGTTETEASAIVSIADVPHVALDLKTPQRAAEVFGFLVERRKPMREHSLPALPLSTGTLAKLNSESNSSSSHLSPPTPDTATSSPTSFEDSQSHVSHAQIRTATLTKLSTAPAVLNPFSSSTASSHYDSEAARHCENPTANLHSTDASPEGPKVRQATTISTPSDVTNIPASRIPRGPRPQRPKQELSNVYQADLLIDDTHRCPSAPEARHKSDMFRSTTSASIPLDPRIQRGTEPHNTLTPIVLLQHRRSGSRASIIENMPSDLEDTDYVVYKATGPTRAGRARELDWEDKENSAEISPNPSPGYTKTTKPASGLLPTTPLRSRSIFDVRFSNGDYGDGVAPSPASSSELSPVAQDIMTNLRKQRMRAREADRRGRSARAASGSR
ncbi:hypothetical protein AcV5_009206 [Taiwanofungus camphoratus]|nr:hypothetical protein AcV5_009206 [Antrodia cinnamomea]KAI0924505.1 hypothetical protein AcW2_005379 [Antrodia cinnamomea]